MSRTAINCHSCTWDVLGLWDKQGHPRKILFPITRAVPGLQSVGSLQGQLRTSQESPRSELSRDPFRDN